MIVFYKQSKKRILLHPCRYYVHCSFCSTNAAVRIVVRAGAPLRLRHRRICLSSSMDCRRPKGLNWKGSSIGLFHADRTSLVDREVQTEAQFDCGQSKRRPEGTEVQHRG